MLMRLKITSIIKFNTHDFLFTFRRHVIFLVFHPNIGLKTSTYEFIDRIHQNQEGFEGKKLSGKEFVTFEEYQRVCAVDIAGYSESYCFLTWIFASILLVILQNPSK